MLVSVSVSLNFKMSQHTTFPPKIKTDRFVRGYFIIQIIIEMTDMVLKGGIDEVVANLHG